MREFKEDPTDPKKDGYPSSIGMEHCVKYRNVIDTIAALGGTIRRFPNGSHEISILGVTVHTEKGLF